MPPLKDDFALTIEKAAGLLHDSTIELRVAALCPLTQARRRAIRRAIVALERTQDDLFSLRNDQWTPPPPPPRQLELL